MLCVCVVRVKDSAIVWTMLALARLYLATVQTGYIHPDEFHQSVQVMAREYRCPVPRTTASPLPGTFK